MSSLYVVAKLSGSPFGTIRNPARVHQPVFFAKVEAFTKDHGLTLRRRGDVRKAIALPGAWSAFDSQETSLQPYELTLKKTKVFPVFQNHLVIGIARSLPRKRGILQGILSSLCFIEVQVDFGSRTYNQGFLPYLALSRQENCPICHRFGPS